MIRNLKALGLALVAVFAMSAVAASAASAEGGVFHSESASTTITGSQVGSDVFTTTAGTVTCTSATYTGSQSGATSNTIIAVPHYTGCTAFGFAGATINVNGCEYEFHGEETEVDIQGCNNANGIIVTAKLFGVTKCTVTVTEQDGLEGIGFHNTGAGTTQQVSVEVDIENDIEYTHHTGSGAGACASGSASDGDYSGEALVTGSSGGSHTGIWYE